MNLIGLVMNLYHLTLIRESWMMIQMINIQFVALVNDQLYEKNLIHFFVMLFGYSH